MQQLQQQGALNLQCQQQQDPAQQQQRTTWQNSQV